LTYNKEILKQSQDYKLKSLDNKALSHFFCQEPKCYVFNKSKTPTIFSIISESQDSKQMDKQRHICSKIEYFGSNLIKTYFEKDYFGKYDHDFDKNHFNKFKSFNASN
jgi:hypothetical protein